MSAAVKSCLIVFARAPQPGRVKTRLLTPFELTPGAGLRSLLPVEAAALYTAFVADVLAKGAAAGFSRLRLYVDGGLDSAVLQELAAPHGYLLRAQAAGDLGDRLQAAVSAELEAGAHHVVTIGSDSPTLPVTYLERAREILSVLPVEVVLGPSTDGGYYLIGLSKSRPELFAKGMPWSTAGVLPATLSRLADLGAQGVRSALLPFFYDCDTPEDLRLLAAQLRQQASQPPTAGDDELGALPCAAPYTQRALSELSLI